jgi:hypothetical protein
LSTSDLRALESVYRAIEQRGDGVELYRWHAAESARTPRPGPAERGPTREARHLFAIFDVLRRRGVEPFASGTVEFDDRNLKHDWTKLPPELHYLRAPAEKFGRIQFDDQIERFLAVASAEEREQLRGLATHICRSGDAPRIIAWLSWHPSTKDPEGALVTWLMNLLTALGYEWSKR